MNIFIRMAFLFLSFSVFAHAIAQDTNEPGSKEELELGALTAFLGQHRNKILFEGYAEEVLSPDEVVLVITTQPASNAAKIFYTIFMKDLSAYHKDKVVKYRITKASKLYFELLKMQLAKNAIDLIPEDINIFRNLLTPSAYWNMADSLEDSLKRFNKLANIYKNISSQMGCLEFEKFLGFDIIDKPHHVWFETKEYIKGEPLKKLENTYQSYLNELSKNGDNSSIQLPVPFIVSDDKEKLVRQKAPNKSRSGLIVLNGRTYQRELFWKGKFLRRPSHWKEFQTQLFLGEEIHIDYLPLKEQFESIEHVMVVQLQQLCLLQKQNDYQEKEQNSNTIFVIWPTENIIPRTIVFDSSNFSWLSLSTDDLEHPDRPLHFTVLTDTLEGARGHCGGFYITKQKPTREQVLVVELSYARSHEISLDTFNEMKKAFHEQSSEKFWESTNLAGVDLRDIDLLIIVRDNTKLYLPRSMAEQILPSYLVEIPINKTEEQLSGQQ